MSTIALRNNFILGLSERDKAIISFIAGDLFVSVENGPLYQSPDMTVWRIYDDYRLTLNDCANLSVLMSALDPEGSLKDYAYPAELPVTDEVVSNYFGILLLNVPTAEDLEAIGDIDVWEYVLLGNSAPPSLKWFNSVPSDWVPV